MREEEGGEGEEEEGEEEEKIPIPPKLPHKSIPPPSLSHSLSLIYQQKPAYLSTYPPPQLTDSI